MAGTTDESKESSRAFRGVSPSNILSKRTLKLHRILPSFDSERVVFPHGVVSTLRQSGSQAQVRRIEIFANDSNEATYGILRTMFVALSCEKSLLDIAQASDNVIQVRSLPCAQSDAGRVIEDRLVLKRLDKEQKPTAMDSKPYSAKAPSLLVPSSWLERVDLEQGSRIIVSSPIGKYMVPPPNLA